MTTLPHNNPPRMSRPTGLPPATPSAVVPQSGLTGADVIRVIRGSMLLIIISIIVSAVAGYFANSYLAKNHSRYTATGYLEVKLVVAATPNSVGLPPRLDNQTTLLEQRTQVQGLRSEALYSRVLQNQNSAIRQTSWFTSFNNDASAARQDLLKNFAVNPIQETRYISASMQYKDPDAARIIVEEICGEHIRQQKQSSDKDAYDRRQMLQSMKISINSELDTVRNQRQELAKQLSEQGISPSAAINISPFQVEISAAAQSLVEARDRAASFRTQLEQFKISNDAGTVPFFVSRMVDEDPEIKSLTLELTNLNRYLETNKDRQNNPQYQNMKRQHEATLASLEKARTDMQTKLKATLPEDIRNQLSSAEQAVEAALKRLTELQVRQGEISNVAARYQGLVTRETVLATSQREIDDSINVMAQGGVTGTVIEWASSGKPIKPEIPTFPRLPVTLTVAITLGLMLALGIAFAKELLDTTIRSPRDVAKVGPLAVLGMIPHEDDDPQSAGARLPMVIAEAPQSMTAEQLRQFRTRLQHATSLDTTRSLLVTSPNPGDGKTTVAVNLAAGLALVGRRILLVDANFRRPELHRLFEMDNASGFSVALSEPEKLPSLAKSSKIPNLSVLAAGPKPGNTTEMLESALLHDFIEKALEQYDHVIFDSGPVLFASETVALAPRVDGVVTVVRARQSTRGVLARVRETLRQIKAENLGVVINGVRAYGGGYYARNIKTYYEYSSSNGNA